MIQNSPKTAKTLMQNMLVAALLGCGTVASGQTGDRTFMNPYASVNWDAVQPYYANFHTHTVYSDGDFTPHDAIDAYKEMGYHILALTDHDNDFYEARPAVLYPWTELNAIYDEIKDRPNPSWRWQDQLYGEISEPWENRDPDALGMISVPGIEVSLTHHLTSLFNDYAGFTRSEDTAFAEIGKRNGLAFFAHPGRYDRYPDWYAYFYERHDHLIGMEVYNQNDRYPEERDIWDRVLHRLMPGRPVWGSAADDMHTTSHMGWNFTIIPLEELTKSGVREALKSGAFYFYRPREQKSLPALHITRVRVTDDGIQLGGEGEVETIDWITYDPETGQTVVVHEGAHLSMADVPVSARFVRARLIGLEGTAYTQPFGIRTAEPRERPGAPPGDLQEREGWRIYKHDDADLALDTSDGKSGNALRMDYDLTEGHWVSIVKPVGRVSEEAVVRFDIRGGGNGNSIELKLEDGSGATYGQNLPMKTSDEDWYGMEIAVQDAAYWWGGDEDAGIDLSRVGLSFAIVSKGDDPGGAGTLYLDNISIE